MKRYFELFFRHPILFSLPIIVGLVAGVAYSSKQAPTYTVSASLFCDAFLPSSSTLQQPANGGPSPCADRATLLQEYLHTQSFDDNVIGRATHSDHPDPALSAALARSVAVAATGTHVLRFSVKSGSAALADPIAQGVIDEFTAELNMVLKQRANALIAAAQTRLDMANAAVANAQTALAAYVSTHPASNTDLQYTLLADAVTNAQQQRNDAATNLTNAQLLPSGVDPTSQHVVDPPNAPIAASRKKPLILAGGGGFLGGTVITILILIVLMAQDRSVRDEGDLEPTLDVVGTVPQFGKAVLSADNRAREGEAATGFRVWPELADSCRPILRHLERRAGWTPPLSEANGTASEEPAAGNGSNGHGRPLGAHAARNGDGGSSIAVTSALRGEGRSTIAAGLAAATYEAYRLRVVLVELDLDRPSMAQRFGIPGIPGIAEILRDGVPIADCLRAGDGSSVSVIVAGDTKDDPNGLFVRLRGSSLMKEIGAICDVVIADLPPVEPAGQASSLSHLFSSVLLVVRSGTPPLTEIRRALEGLDRPAPVILNGVGSSIPRPLRALLPG
jgi:Mrp family chromosome partitioning ATPase/capsular polysaccharide biosynthesis protein